MCAGRVSHLSKATILTASVSNRGLGVLKSDFAVPVDRFCCVVVGQSVRNMFIPKLGVMTNRLGANSESYPQASWRIKGFARTPDRRWVSTVCTGWILCEGAARYIKN